MRTLLCIVFQLPFFLAAQNEAANWLFGKNTGLNFSSSNPQILSGTAMNNFGNINPVCISDGNGNLLFYARRDTIWNAQHQVMANGTGLVANGIHGTSKLIFKKPGNNQEYYLIYTCFSPTAGLYYSTVDMSLAAGMGSVTAKNLTIFSGSTLPTITGAKHCNGQDYWLLMHDLNNFRSYLISATGINTTAVISAGPTFSVSTQSCMKINPQGTKLGFIGQVPPTSLIVNFYDFNRSTGTLSNLIPISGMFGLAAAGCEFSPDGSKFYFSEQSFPLKTHQIDLCSGNTNTIAASDFTVAGVGYSFSRALNGKIYYTTPGMNFLGVIHNPNASGLAMNLVHQGFDMSPQITETYLPYFINSQTREQFQYSQGLGCYSTQFYAPSISNPSIASCWSSGNTVTGFFWNFGDPSSGPLNTSTVSSPSHTYSAFGTYTVKLAMSYSSCAADTISQVISITQGSATLLSPSVACNGLTSASLNVWGGSGNYTYTWMPGAISGSVATALPNGTYTIQVIDNTYNCQQSFTANVQSPSVHISAVIQSTPYCNFSNAQVNVTNGSGNYSYLWQPGGQTTSGVNNLGPGVYTVNISDANNNCSFVHTLQITPLALPNLSTSPNATICAGQSHTITAGGADTYLWSNGSTNPSITVSPASTSFYSITGTLNATGCSAGKTITITVLPCLGILETTNEESWIQIFPNPNQGLFTIQSKEAGVLKVYSVLGTEVYSVQVQEGIREMDLRVLSNGLYYLKVEGKSESQAIKLIKTAL